MNPATPQLPLRDIHLPQAISWWPPAIGWWIVLFLVLFACFAAWLFYKRWQKRKRQRDSIHALAKIRIRFNEDQNRVQLLRDLSVLMRRSCISFYPRHISAGLTGDQWLEFLDATSVKTKFSDGIGNALASAPYLPETAQIDIDATALIDLCEHWLRAQPNKKYLKSRKAISPIGGQR